MNEAIAYFRTSSAANVDGDSEARQRAAVVSYGAAKYFLLRSELHVSAAVDATLAAASASALVLNLIFVRAGSIGSAGVPSRDVKLGVQARRTHLRSAAVPLPCRFDQAEWRG